jgi:hypothetical protein
MASHLGRPRKYGRPARAVTVTLPEDILGRLAATNADLGSAIVNLVERKTATRIHQIAPAEIARFGRHAVIVVTPVKALRRLKGVHLVPIGDGRALISLDPSHSIQALELQVRDAVDRRDASPREREILESIAEILRTTRASREQSLEARTIIVLETKSRRLSHRIG